VHQQTCTVATRGRGTYDITAEVAAIVASADCGQGLCHLFIAHTSASLAITENADPAVLRDLERFMADLVPDGDARFEHDAEGPDDMPAHVRSVLTQTELTVPVRNGQLQLGTWQGIYLWEHRSADHQRRIIITVNG
jgi:secondary thiamine-phosphate synthase enzyme